MIAINLLQNNSIMALCKRGREKRLLMVPSHRYTVMYACALLFKLQNVNENVRL